MTANRKPRSLPNEQKLRLWGVGWALALAFAGAVLAAGGTLYGLVVLLDFQKIDTSAKLDAKTLFDLVKLSFGVVAGAGALVALVVAYRRQRVDEAGAHREATRLHTERFSQAVDKLGLDSPAVRLGGVHALAGLADDAPDDSLRQTCIDVLCAYLQLPFTPDPGTDPAHQEEHHRYLAFRKVRHTILRLIGDHYRRPKGTHRSWQGCDLDLTGVTIDGDMDFAGATFSGGTTSFAGATFSGGDVSFAGATFSGGTTSFAGATFSGGEVSFDNATFSGSTVYFGATFSGGTVYFAGATFSGGTVYFDVAMFSRGNVSFADATFSGGDVYFRSAMFSGGDVYFRSAMFSGGDVSFADATFSGGDVSFNNATFSDGDVSFADATFSAGTVSFDDATGSAPQGLPAAVGTHPPSGITLPSAWLLSAP
ncbi:pentapeptide repeat-containing protein (plasmid) [Streptomyces anulatus]|uniref:pentapeptide repeat-containing protein n=1 Tax=Streptomyces anulatus TaxID=1892 RepID=UPI002F907098|nr:pentapeptide repeat-containing protein [Streptomyces anulatus]